MLDIPNTRRIRPGIMLQLRTEITGGVSYSKRDLDTRATGETVITSWETVKTIQNAEEFARAVKVRADCRNHVTAVCLQTEWGLLIPTDREVELDSRIAKAREWASAHNATATVSFVEVRYLKGKVEADDAQAVREISQEVARMMSRMEEGIAKADPKAIRDAADSAREIGAMLSPENQGKVSAAVEEARKAAREITRRVGKSGERAARVIQGLSTEAIRSARFSFLDFDAPTSTEATPEAMAPVSAPVDLIPETSEVAPEATEAAPVPATPTLDF
jgi:hypothetical protein